MQTPYIARQLVKDRLQLGGVPIPLDPHLDQLIRTASEMVRDRCIAFDESAPPDPVQQVTLMLTVRLRISETGGYTDADGRPVQVALWTQDLTDILGKWIQDATPDPQVATAGTLRTSRYHESRSEYRRPRYVELDGDPLDCGWNGGRW
jgi:hypothetical protein